MADTIETAVDELRAACKVTRTGEVTSTVSLDIEPHGPRDVSIAVAPMEGNDDRWFLEVSVRHGRNRGQQWLGAGTRDDVLGVLHAPDVVEKIAAAAKGIADADFHTDGLPER